MLQFTNLILGPYIKINFKFNFKQYYYENFQDIFRSTWEGNHPESSSLGEIEEESISAINNLTFWVYFSVQPGFPRSVGAWGRRLAVQGRRGCRRRRRRWRCWCRRQQDGLRPRQRPVRLTVWDGPTGQGGRSPHPGFLSTFLGRTLACPSEAYTSRPRGLSLQRPLVLVR